MTGWKPPQAVRIVEVGPRDGLQNEHAPIPTDVKVEFVTALVEAGLRDIEATSFVHPHMVPQLADASDLCHRLPRAPDVTYSALVPNEKGLDRALAAGVKRIAVFTAASETFTQHNINMTIAQSLTTFAKLVERARAAGVTARGYVSTAFVCPFEGDVPPERVREVALRLLDLGVDEVSVSDTLGAAAPPDIFATVGHLLRDVPASKLALHLHDTYGTALANVVAGMQLGITTFDAAAGGLGGCPFAPGAAGNLATEDLVYMLERMGVQTGVKLAAVVDAAHLVADRIGRPLTSRQSLRLRGLAAELLT